MVNAPSTCVRARASSGPVSQAAKAGPRPIDKRENKQFPDGEMAYDFARPTSPGPLPLRSNSQPYLIGAIAE